LLTVTFVELLAPVTVTVTGSVAAVPSCGITTVVPPNETDTVAEDPEVELPLPPHPPAVSTNPAETTARRNRSLQLMHFTCSKFTH
jgi:hypothetical protein